MKFITSLPHCCPLISYRTEKLLEERHNFDLYDNTSNIMSLYIYMYICNYGPAAIFVPLYVSTYTVAVYFI